MKNFLMICVFLALASCTTTKYETVYKYVDRPAPVAPKTKPAVMKPLQWKVINKAELIKILQELETNPDPKFALIALTPKGYENLSSNLIEVNRVIREQKEVIFYYQRYVEETKSPAQPVK